MQQRARGGMSGSDVTNDDVVLFHYLWYEFCHGRRGAGRRFSDSTPLEVRIKLPSVGWIKTLITSGDIYWTAFAGVRTGSHRPSRFTSRASAPRPSFPPPFSKFPSPLFPFHLRNELLLIYRSLRLPLFPKQRFLPLLWGRFRT